MLKIALSVDGDIRTLSAEVPWPAVAGILEHAPGTAREKTHAAVAGLVSELLEDAGKRFGLYPLGPLRIAAGEITAGEPLGIRVSFEALPEIAFPDDPADLHVDVEEALVQPGEMRAVLHNLRRARGTLLPVGERRRPIPGDILTVDVSVACDGQPRPGLSRRGFVFQYKENSSFPEILEAARLLAKGETRTVRFSSPASWAGRFPAETLLELTVTLSDLRKEHLPELDDRFARACGQPSLQKLYEAVYRKSLARKMDLARERAKDTLLETLLATTSFPVSRGLARTLEDMLAERLKGRLLADGVPPDEAEQELERQRASLALEAEHQGRRQMLLMAAGYKYGVSVSDEDIRTSFPADVAEAEGGTDALCNSLMSTDAAYLVRDRLLAVKTLEFLYSRARRRIVDANGAPVPRPSAEMAAAKPEENI